MKKLAVCLVSALAALVSCSPAAVAAPPPAAGPLVVRFDPAAARAQGWVAEAATAEDVHQALLGFVRWRLGAAGIEHELVATPDGATVRTPDAARAGAHALLAALGTCELYLVAEESDVAGGLAAERARFEAWRKERPARPWLDYNADAARPAPTIAWFPTRYGTEELAPLPLLLPRGQADAFGNRAFARVFPTTGNLSHPAIGFELTDASSGPFESFTAGAVKRQLAIVLDANVRSAPILNSKLVKSAMIEGKFTADEQQHLIERIRAGSPAPVTLVD